MVGSTATKILPGRGQVYYHEGKELDIQFPDDFKEVIQYAIYNRTMERPYAEGHRCHEWPSTLTSLVTQASDEYTGLFATNTTLSTENEQLKQENTRLKEANLELFLRVGQQNIDKTGGSGQSTEQKTKAETITVEDLFKEVK